MAVYLEVAPKDQQLAPSGTQTLSGSECLVFYLGGVPSTGSRHTGGLNILLGDGSVRYARDLDTIVTELVRTPPRGVGTIIIGPSNQTGYVTRRWLLSPGSREVPSLGLTNAGGTAVVIGLLLPAVQAAREAARTKAHPSLQTLKSIAGPRGQVFVIDNDNTLLPV